MKIKILAGCIIILLLTLVFSGCTSDNKNDDNTKNDNSKDAGLFIGTWKMNLNESINVEDIDNILSIIWSFDDSEENKHIGEDYSYLEKNITNKDGKSHITSTYWKMTTNGIYITSGYDYTYQFSEDNTHLVLFVIDESDPWTYVFDKISI